MKDQIQEGLTASFQEAEISVDVDGNRCLVRIVSQEFEGLRPVQRQQRVYACLNDLISSGELHAVTIQAHTPSEVDS